MVVTPFSIKKIIFHSFGIYHFNSSIENVESAVALLINRVKYNAIESAEIERENRVLNSGFHAFKCLQGRFSREISPSLGIYRAWSSTARISSHVSKMLRRNRRSFIAQGTGDVKERLSKDRDD